jgi:AmiR/NasT family two-component response regulator
MPPEIQPATSSIATRASLPSVRVLVALGDGVQRESLVRQLGEFGHTVVADVGTGTAASERAKELTPDVVLLDAHLPDESGVDAAQRIASDHREVAVILLTDDECVPLTQEEMTNTTAIAMLPSATSPRVMDSTVRLAVYRARELTTAHHEVAEMHRQLENRKAIERAKGILMRRTGLTEQEAYRILQRTSQDRSVPMAVVAKEVLESEPGKT